jgi:uncharacterized protein
MLRRQAGRTSPNASTERLSATVRADRGLAGHRGARKDGRKRQAVAFLCDLALALCIALLATTDVAVAEIKARMEHGGRGLVGTLSLPPATPRPPVVLMLPGFTNDKDGFILPPTGTGLFAHMAQRLAARGIASLRIDFHGSGESEGPWEETTTTSQIHDAVLAFDYLQTLTTVDVTRVAILGHSQGGLVGGHLAALRPEASSVVLWAPVIDPVASYSTIMGAQTVQQAIAGPDDALITAPLSWGGETRLKSGFFKELPRVTPVGMIGRYSGPLMVVVGARDEIVSPQPASGLMLLDYHPGDEDLLVVNTDHYWNVGETMQTLDQIVIRKTIEWFERSFLADDRTGIDAMQER